MVSFLNFALTVSRAGALPWWPGRRSCSRQVRWKEGLSSCDRGAAVLFMRIALERLIQEGSPAPNSDSKNFFPFIFTVTDCQKVSMCFLQKNRAVKALITS